MRTVVAITGASSGIGEVYARKLAAGHDLILIARRRGRLESLAAQLHDQYGATVDVVVADLTQPTELEEVAARIEGEDRLALLVNNAGFGARGLFWESEYQTAEKMHQLHVMATMRLCHAALRNMVPRDYGAIINVASVAAFVRTAGSIAYAATKSWMTTFTEGLYLELRAKGSEITVQALCPGYTYSEFHDALGVSRPSQAPRAFWLTAEEVVDCSLAALARRKLFVVPGWKYRVLTAVLSKLPSRLRLLTEAGSSRVRNAGELASGARKQIS